MNGIINIYKEKGFTSHDVVAKLRGIVHQKKIGHTGTLDPDATGVLPVCLGKGTKVCDLLTDRTKTYVAVVRLGLVTDTQDLTGTVQEQNEVCADLPEIEQVVEKFVGEIWQTPPMYSAIKVNGKRLYELARQGIEVERKKRRITIYSCEVTAYDAQRHEFTMRVVCSKGTYIRTLCQDIGEMLGCGACMASLVRTAVGSFQIEHACKLDEIKQYWENGTIDKILLPVEAVFEEYPSVVVRQEGLKLLKNGNEIQEAFCFLDRAVNDGDLVKMYDEKHSFYAVYCYKEKRRAFANHKMFFTE